MIKFHQHKDINLVKWDSCIGDAINRKIQAFSWYLNTVTNNSWDALLLDDYKSVIPLPYRIKYGIKYIYMPYFLQYLGCFVQDEKHFELFRDFVNYIPSNIKFIDYNFNSKIELSFKNKFILTKKTNQILDIKDDYNKIFNSFNSSNKKNIRRSSLHNLKFEKTPSDFNADEFISFFKTNLSSSLGFHDKDYTCLNDLIKISISKGSGVIYVVKQKNVILNSVFLFPISI